MDAISKTQTGYTVSMTKPLRLLLYLFIVFTAPLIGVWICDETILPYLVLPPIPVRRETANFSWIAFSVILLLIVMTVSPFLIKIFRTTKPTTSSHTPNAFPAWGWLGVIWLGGCWILAWTRFNWFAPLQEFTFTPLWLGYIAIVNALTYQRTGQCMLTHRTRYFLMLFPLSALLWWSFEYLNRFSGNWHYVGISEFSAWRYFVFSTLPFSTVLPAVLGTTEWLTTFSRVSAGLDNFVRLRLPRSRLFAGTLIGLSALLLSAMSMWPRFMYPVVWLAPVMLIVGLQIAIGTRGVLKRMERGDWRQAWCAALACLICGVFWEMWNAYSLAHWEYTIPYTQRFHIFEMPALGYAGYLPFGLVCVFWVQTILDTADTLTEN